MCHFEHMSPESEREVGGDEHQLHNRAAGLCVRYLCALSLPLSLYLPLSLELLRGGRHAFAGCQQEVAA